jgi:inorganic pyrophosphatase
MTESVYIKELIKSTRNYDIEKYRQLDFFKTHISFEGTPKKHTTDKTRVILVADPFSEEKSFYEFPVTAIDYIEEIETIAAEDGRSAPRIRLWIRKGTLGFRYEPFMVGGDR